MRDKALNFVKQAAAAGEYPGKPADDVCYCNVESHTLTGDSGPPTVWIGVAAKNGASWNQHPVALRMDAADTLRLGPALVEAAQAVQPMSMHQLVTLKNSVLLARA
jgi:hypothetical protein